VNAPPTAAFEGELAPVSKNIPLTASAELQRTATAFRFIDPPDWTVLFDPFVEFKPLSARSQDKSYDG
jgi:hypothetical protein